MPQRYHLPSGSGGNPSWPDAIKGSGSWVDHGMGLQLLPPVGVDCGDTSSHPPVSNEESLVARIRAAGLTQKEIAETAGVSRPTVASDLASMPNPDIEAAGVITNSRGQQRPATVNGDLKFSSENSKWKMRHPRPSVATYLNQQMLIHLPPFQTRGVSSGLPARNRHCFCAL